MNGNTTFFPKLTNGVHVDAVLPAIPTLSIVVLPFTNLTGDASQAYVAEGLAVSITSDLARLRDTYIVNPATAAGYKNKDANVQQIGKDFGVRFVLQGQVQRAGNRLRINAQLADIASNAQLWSQVFEGDSSNLFALQDQITSRIGVSIGREMLVAAQKSLNPKNSTNVGDMVLRFRALSLATKNKDTLQKIETLGEDILKLDPDNVTTLALLGATQLFHVNYLGQTLTPQEKLTFIDRAYQHALRAKKLEPNYWRTYNAFMQYAEAKGDYPAMLDAAQTLLRLAPNEQLTNQVMGHVLVFGGDYKNSLKYSQRGIDLDPKHPLDEIIFGMGWAYFSAGDYPAAIKIFSDVIQRNPNYFGAWAWMAMAYAQLGQMDKATEMAARWRAADPQASFFTRRRPIQSAPPAYRDFYRKVFWPAARKAGLTDKELPADI